MVKKEYKDYNIHRNHWWKFWAIDELEFILHTRYQDAYKEVEKKTKNGYQYSMELESWVIEDIREQLLEKVVKCPGLVRKAKSLRVQFSSTMNNPFNRYLTTIPFYCIDRSIYFDSDESIKREKLLNKLGI